MFSFPCSKMGDPNLAGEGVSELPYSGRESSRALVSCADTSASLLAESKSHRTRQWKMAMGRLYHITKRRNLDHILILNTRRNLVAVFLFSLLSKWHYRLEALVDTHIPDNTSHCIYWDCVPLPRCFSVLDAAVARSEYSNRIVSLKHVVPSAVCLRE